MRSGIKKMASDATKRESFRFFDLTSDQTNAELDVAPIFGLQKPRMHPVMIASEMTSITHKMTLKQCVPKPLPLRKVVPRIEQFSITTSRRGIKGDDPQRRRTKSGNRLFPGG